MSEDQNEAVIRRFYDEVLNQRNLAACDEICAPDAVLHSPFPDPGQGPEGLRKTAGALTTGFPDLEVALDELIAKDDRVLARWRTVRQTHTGAYRGIPPTGREVRMTALQLWRLADGKIAESWLELDALGGAQQMGVVPPEGISSGRRALFVLGSLGRFAFLEARHQLRRNR